MTTETNLKPYMSLIDKYTNMPCWFFMIDNSNDYFIVIVTEFIDNENKKAYKLKLVDHQDERAIKPWDFGFARCDGYGYIVCETRAKVEESILELRHPQYYGSVISRFEIMQIDSPIC